MMMIHVCFRSTKTAKARPTANVIQLTFAFLEELRVEEQLARETLPRARRARPTKTSTPKSGKRS